MKKTDLRVTKTLRQIDEALLTCIENRPFRDVSLGMLCEAAMINKTTFYKYYRDKYDCLDRYLDRLMAEFRASLDAGFVLASPEQIDSLDYQKQFEDLSRYVYSRRRELRIFWRAQTERQLFIERMQALDESIIEKAEAHRSYDARQRAHLELYAHLFSFHAMSLFEWWLRHDTLVSVEDIKALMSGNLKQGFFTTFKRLL